MLELSTLISYWMLTALCLIIFGLYLRVLKQLKVSEENEANLQSMINAIPGAICYTCSERKIVSVNREFESIMGYSIDDLAGKATSMLYESNDEYERLGRIRFINQSITDEHITYAANYRRKDGSTFIGETFSQKLISDDGLLLGFIALTKDITERKKSEEKLKLAASVFSHAREGIIIADTASFIVDVNDTVH
jgi:PAS domain S-box-containing protein